MAHQNKRDNRIQAKLSEFREIVEKFLELGGISKKELAENAGVSYGTLLNFLAGSTPFIRFATLEKILFAVAHELKAENAPPASPARKKRTRRK